MAFSTSKIDSSAEPLLPSEWRTYYSDVLATDSVFFCTSTKQDEEQAKHKVWKVVEPLVAKRVNGPVGKLWTKGAWKIQAPFEQTQKPV
jgi:hypothetical protein